MRLEFGFSTARMAIFLLGWVRWHGMEWAKGFHLFSPEPQSRGVHWLRTMKRPKFNLKVVRPQSEATSLIHAWLCHHGAGCRQGDGQCAGFVVATFTRRVFRARRSRQQRAAPPVFPCQDPHRGSPARRRGPASLWAKIIPKFEREQERVDARISESFR